MKPHKIISAFVICFVISMVSSSAYAGKDSNNVETNIPPFDGTNATANAIGITDTKTSGAMSEPDFRSGEQINWQVISGGGNLNGTSANFKLSGTAGQTAVGTGTSDNYATNHGFWQDFGDEPGCCDLAGDSNNNGAVNILDVTYTINYLYKGGPPPVCNDEADANGNNQTNILDVTHLINYLYKGGPPPQCGTTGT